MPQQLFIPALGTLVSLAEDWTFELFFEFRNNTLLQALCPNPEGDRLPRWRKWGCHEDDHAGSELLRHLEPMDEKELKDAHSTYRSTNGQREPYLQVTFPAGMQLKFDRIYIRAGVTAYNSVTFRTMKNCPEKKFRSKRFWVKLQDANNIICNVIG